MLLADINPHISYCRLLPLYGSPLVLFNNRSQFVLLLAMFVKPMLLPQGSTQSGGAVYRRVVNRNILCTVCIVFTYSITTLIVVLALLGSSHTVRITTDYIHRIYDLHTKAPVAPVV